jgi:hypothetical protein
MYKKSIEHLKKSQESYFSHLVWAIYAGIKMILVGFSSIIHGIIPAWFTGTAAKTVIDFYYKRLVNHPNKEYQEYIRNANNKVCTERNTDSIV